MCLLRIFLFASLRLPIRHFPTPDSQHQCRSSGSTRADAERQCRASHRPESTRSSAREQRPGAAISVTALASWCFNESWTARLAADEVVPMLFRMGYDGRRLRAHLESGGDFRGGECRSSLGVATDELPAALPTGRRIYVFSPRRWTAETYNTVRTRIGR